MRVGTIVASRGGLKGDYGYDASVYYTAADAFVHGQLPYRHFVLLHPPGIMLVLAPFAELGRATTDLTGFVTADIAFALLGAINGVLVYSIALRMGTSRGAAVLGGAFYATWYGAVFAEISTRLEPLGSFAFLCGLLALTGSGSRNIRRAAVLGGIALGFAASVKIWWLAALIVIAVWVSRRPDGRTRLKGYVAGALGAVLVVDGPFFVFAPSDMLRFILLDQSGRSYSSSPVDRLLTASTLSAVWHGASAALGAALFLAVLAALCAVAWHLRPARIAIVVTAVHLAILLAAPSFFPAYLDLLAPALAVVVAASASGLQSRRVRQFAVGALVVGAACITTLSSLIRANPVIAPFPRAQIAAALPHVPCVTALTPMTLIELDVLSRNFDRGCVQWVDAYGRTYSIDKAAGSPSPGRRQNQTWQRDVRRYLLSGQVTIVDDKDASLSRQTLRIIARNRPLAHVGHLFVYRVVR